MKSMKIFFLLIICFAVSLTVFAQRTSRGGTRLQQVFIERAGGCDRGWIKKEDGKSVFIDMEGKTSDIGEKEKVYTLAQMNARFNEFQRSVMMKEKDPSDQDEKIVDWAKSNCLYEVVAEFSKKIIRMNPATPDPVAEKNLEFAKEKILALRAGPSGGSASNWTMDDVQKVRFALLPVEKPLKGTIQITFKNDVNKNFYSEKEKQRDFMRKTPLEQAQIIKKETGSQYQPDIVIGRDPAVMMEFQRAIQPMLNRGCSTGDCHSSGSFKLVSKPASLPDKYFNFHVLDTYKSDLGVMIDHKEPEKSLLVRWLSAEDNVTHPKEKLTPLIKTKNDSRYKQIIKWIKDLPEKSIDELLGEAKTTDQAQD